MDGEEDKRIEQKISLCERSWIIIYLYTQSSALSFLYDVANCRLESMGFVEDKGRAELLFAGITLCVFFRSVCLVICHHVIKLVTLAEV